MGRVPKGNIGGWGDASYVILHWGSGRKVGGKANGKTNGKASGQC